MRGVYALAEGCDLLVIESTYLDFDDTRWATATCHLTAGQAAKVGADGGVRRMASTHFTQRYGDPERFHEEAAAEFSGEIVVAADPGPEDRGRHPLGVTALIGEEIVDQGVHLFG